MARGPLYVALTYAAIAGVASPAPAAAPAVRAIFADPAAPTLVVAHRACHAAAPDRGLAAAAPENSLAGIERCIALGIDMAEVDVRRTKDGHLVLIHDGTVDRTTNGSGKVDEMTLAEIRALRQRIGEGGPGAALTDQRIPTLEEALDIARGRILLNLDIRSSLYGDTIAAVRKAGASDIVVVKERAAIGSPALASTPPFDLVPFMPILAGEGGELAAVASRQLSSGHPVALELPRMPSAMLPALAAIARSANIRLWGNSLWEGFIQGYGGDREAIRRPARVWGRMIDGGISIIQTDAPAALQDYLRSRNHAAGPRSAR